MAIDRRQFLQLAPLALGLSAGLTSCGGAKGRLVGGYRTRSETYGVAAIHTDGRTLWQSTQAGRLHEILPQPERGVVAAVARRPGYFISLLDLDSGAPLAQIQPPDGLLLEGHGLWQDDLLWVCAAEQSTASGWLLGYEPFGGRPQVPVARLALPGLGPHQLVAQQDQLVVALGGWQTRGRDVLNADNFASALAWVHPASGAMRLQPSPHADLSLRHLARDGEHIWAGLQYANPYASTTPLVYRTQGDNWQAVATPTGGWELFSGYIGSLALANNELVATSPQGHRYGRWDSRSGACLESTSALDICAAAASADDWFIGSGTGAMRDANSGWQQTNFFWDNHWSWLPG